MQPHKQRKISTRPLKAYARYSSIAFQMMAIILAGVFGGIKLDAWVNIGFPVFTVVLSLLSVFFAIYFVVRDLLK
jgi:F0F1-type ATP synthase assembly protein I